MSKSTPTSPQGTQPNTTRPILVQSSSVPTVPTTNRLKRLEHGPIARPAISTDFAPGAALVQSRASLMGKLSGDTLSFVKSRCGKKGEISRSKVRSAYMTMAEFTRFPRQEKTREEKRTKAAQRYAIQRFNGTPNLSSAGQILRDKLVSGANNRILLAKQALAEQDEREAQAQAGNTTEKEVKRQAELAEQAVLLDSLGLSMNPNFAAAHSAQCEDGDDDDGGFPIYAAACPGESGSGATSDSSESTGEEAAGE